MSENWKSPHEYNIGGCKVSFPVKAYPSQMAMMSKIIGSLQKGRNCLLESPTGSGKSLALLCASLAWQRAEIQRVAEYNEAVRNGIIEPEEVAYDPNQEDPDDPDPGMDTGAGFFVPNNEAAFRDDDEDGDFQNPNYRAQEKVLQNPPPVEKMEVTSAAAANSNNTGTKKVYKKKVPRIFFGTRTHKQLSQIIRELRRTSYSDVKMSILGSREHTCIEPNVSKMKNKNEGCHDLRENGGCSFMGNVKSKLSDHYSFSQYRGKNEAWDLEDMVKVGKKVRACPYYAVRELKNKSHIIFCPYNYLVEPTIRKSMEIHLKNNIVILDEAHNIEDSARSAASGSLSQTQIRDAMNDCEKMAKFYQETHLSDPGPYFKMVDMFQKLSTFIDEAKDETNDPACQVFNEFGSTSKVWTGTNAVARFNVHGLGPSTFKEEFVKPFEIIAADIKMKAEEDESRFSKNPESKVPVLTTATMSVIEGFFMVIQHLYDKDQKFRDDFRVALVKTQENFRNRGANKDNKGWMSKGRGSMGTVLDYVYSINFWCLNPAVIFDDLKDSVRSIVLTSGTLSPMTSFSSELCVEFPTQLEANHVIDKKQVWIGTLSHGPSGVELKATYEHTESYQFQDEIGKLTLGVCNTIAHGVLLFLPSYKLLNKLSERWQQTGLWNQICNKKVIITEPRFSDEFEASIRHFNEVIETTTDHSEDGVDGALFIAVCRGKVSEGLDFADNNARAVICLGIPFPAFMDPQVKLKMHYNDNRHKTDKGILTGRDWYEIQAFRALNQALGRCIRHRKDWGAILMVDQRYAMNRRYVDSLSKWVRNGVTHYNNCQDVLTQLTQFRQDMRGLDQEYLEERAKKKIMEPPVEMSQPSRSKQSKNFNKRQNKRVPINEWVSKGPAKPVQASMPVTQEASMIRHFNEVIETTITDRPICVLDQKDLILSLPVKPLSSFSVNSSTTNEITPEKENSPAKKKFKFSPSATVTSEVLSNSSSNNTQSGPQFKFKPTGASNADSMGFEAAVQNTQETSVMPKRKGFVAPRRKPDFYGDDESDDDFQ